MELDLIIKLTLGALKSGNNALVAVLMLIGLVAGIRKYAGDRIPWLKTRQGATLFSFTTSFGGAIVAGLSNGMSFDGDLLLRAAEIALAAMGGYDILSKSRSPKRLTLKKPDLSRLE